MDTIATQHEQRSNPKETNHKQVILVSILSQPLRRKWRVGLCLVAQIVCRGPGLQNKEVCFLISNPVLLQPRFRGLGIGAVSPALATWLTGLKDESKQNDHAKKKLATSNPITMQPKYVAPAFMGGPLKGSGTACLNVTAKLCIPKYCS